MRKILKCPKCNMYTLSSLCADCKISTIIAAPAKFSPMDPYGSYRRKLKKTQGGIIDSNS